MPLTARQIMLYNLLQVITSTAVLLESYFQTKTMVSNNVNNATDNNHILMDSTSINLINGDSHSW